MIENFINQALIIGFILFTITVIFGCCNNKRFYTLAALVIGVPVCIQSIKTCPVWILLLILFFLISIKFKKSVNPKL